MARSVGLLSSHVITPRGLAKVMQLLGGIETEYGWQISKDDHQIFVSVATDELDILPEHVLEEAYDELEEIPVSLIVSVFNDRTDDDFVWQLTRAAGIALAEKYPIVMHDYANPPERLYAPGQRPIPENRNR